ncbi:hypothetical protein G3O06_25425 [Burkholderia sp. Ac-20345]|nr:hypothetical protein [Burkholderia sp. Ac-20345]MBN3780857.1 hypothetical protein [Burkholderia sp. Ac-20345]
MRDAAALCLRGNEKARIDNTVDAGPMRFWRLCSMHPGFVLSGRNT